MYDIDKYNIKLETKQICDIKLVKILFLLIRYIILLWNNNGEWMMRLFVKEKEILFLICKRFFMNIDSKNNKIITQFANKFSFNCNKLKT